MSQLHRGPQNAMDIVELIVLEAEGLQFSDVNRPIFCLISAGKQKFRTRSVPCSERPQWEEAFMIDVSKLNTVVVSLWSSDTFASDDLLGDAVIDMESVNRTILHSSSGGSAITRVVSFAPPSESPRSPTAGSHFPISSVSSTVLSTSTPLASAHSSVSSSSGSDTNTNMRALGGSSPALLTSTISGHATSPHASPTASTGSKSPLPRSPLNVSEDTGATSGFNFRFPLQPRVGQMNVVVLGQLLLKFRKMPALSARSTAIMQSTDMTPERIDHLRSITQNIIDDHIARVRQAAEAEQARTEGLQMDRERHSARRDKDQKKEKKEHRQSLRNASPSRIMADKGPGSAGGSAIGSGDAARGSGSHNSPTALSPATSGTSLQVPGERKDSTGGGSGIRARSPNKSPLRTSVPELPASSPSSSSISRSSTTRASAPVIPPLGKTGGLEGGSSGPRSPRGASAAPLHSPNRHQPTQLSPRGSARSSYPMMPIAPLRLDLANVGLVGKLPSFVTELSTSWTALNLSCNQLRVMPECGPLTALKSLNLSFNQLVALPSSLGQSLLPLRELLLAGNGITFVAPELAQLSRLEKIDLSSNALSTLPLEFFNMPKLQELILAYNPLISLPRTISGMQSLLLLDVAGCALTKLPEEMTLLPVLKVLNVGGNRITELPNSMGRLTALESLHLVSNQLTYFPLSMAHCASLQFCSIANNPIIDQELIEAHVLGVEKFVDTLRGRMKAAESFRNEKRRQAHMSQAILHWQNPQKKNTKVTKQTILQKGDNGHRFEYVHLAYVQCNQCAQWIWGIGKNGYECGDCKFVCHKKCVAEVNTDCPGQAVTIRVQRKGFIDMIRKGSKSSSNSSQLTVPSGASNAAIGGDGSSATQRRRSMSIAAADVKTGRVSSSGDVPGSNASAPSPFLDKASSHDRSQKANQDPKYLFLIQACKIGNLALLKSLVDTQHTTTKHLRTVSSDTNTPLHLACYFGHDKCAEFLLQQDKDLIHCRNGSGMTPLHTAAQMGQLACVKLLLDSGSDVNSRAYQTGDTPLHFAAERGHLDVVKLLVDQRKASVSVLNTKGKSALEKAILKNQTAVIQFLEQKSEKAYKRHHEVKRLKILGRPTDPLAWVRKKTYLVADAFDVMSSDFNLFDADGSGGITLEELKKAYSRMIEGNVDFSELETLFKHVDEDGSNTIDQGEFYWLMYLWVQNEKIDSLLLLKEDAKLVRRAFKLMEKCFKHADVDNSGTITKEEMRVFLSDLNGISPPLDDYEMAERLRVADVDIETTDIDFKTFIRVMRCWRFADLIPIQITDVDARPLLAKRPSFDDSSKMPATLLYCVLDTVLLEDLKKAISAELGKTGELELRTTHPVTGKSRVLKRNRDLEAAVIQFQNRRGVDNRYLQVGVAKVKVSETSQQLDKPTPSMGSSIGGMKKPMGLGLGLKLNIEAAAKADLPYVAWLKSTTRPKFAWEVPNSEIQTDKCIGRGGCGEVYRGTFKGRVVAVKRLQSKFTQEDVIKAFVKEIEMMAKMHHPNILGFVGASLEYPDINFMTAFMEKGSLNDVIKNEAPSFNLKIKMAKEAASGLNFLHCLTPPIVHRDIKTYNFLVDKDFHVVVADFGVSEELQTDDNRRATRWGTVNWMPPEVFDGNVYDKPSDVFSFGMVLWELLTGQIPFGEATNSLMVLQLIDAGERPFIPTGTNKEFEKLIRSCWETEPSKRPTFSEVIMSLDKCLLEVSSDTASAAIIVTSAPTSPPPSSGSLMSVTSSSSATSVGTPMHLTPSSP